MAVNSNDVTLHIVEEAGTEAGVPATPVWQPVKRTAGDFVRTRSFVGSATINPTRAEGKQINNGAEVNGDLTSEMAIVDPALQLLVKGALQANVVTVDVTGTDIAFVNGTSVITSVANAFTDLEVGHYFVPFGSPLNERPFRVESKTNNGELVISPAPQTESAGASVNVKGIQMRQAANRVSFSGQKRLPWDSGTVYETYTGLQVGSMNFGLSPQSTIEVSTTLIGRTKLDQTTPVTGQTDGAQTAADLLGTVAGVTEFWDANGAVSVNDTCYTDFSIDLNNNATGVPAVGLEGFCAISYGNGQVTGTLNTIADSTTENLLQAEQNKFDNETKFPLGVTLKDASGNYLIVNMPSIQYTEFTRPSTSGELLQNQGSFAGEGDTYGYIAQFTFIAAP